MFFSKKKEQKLSADSKKKKLSVLVECLKISRENLNDERLPECGILQFFISDNDDVYGMDFDEADSQANFRIVYHETIDEGVTREDVLALKIPVNTDESLEYLPITKELAISLHKETVCMGADVCGFDELFAKIVREEFAEDTKGKTAYSTINKKIDSEMADEEDYVMWGDCGVANFFINSEALKRKDFSKVMYNWDCC